MNLKEACGILNLPQHPLPGDEALRKAFRRGRRREHLGAVPLEALSSTRAEERPESAS